MHGIKFLQEDEDMAYKLQQDWESLYLGALFRSATLETTKDRFCDMTVDEIEMFIKEILQFAEDFEKNGPGSVGDDLDRGMKMMDVRFFIGTQCFSKIILIFTVFICTRNMENGLRSWKEEDLI